MFLRYSAELEPSAIGFLDSCDGDEALRVRALIGEIQDDPSIDEVEKIALIVPPIVFRVLVKQGYWIAYHIQSFKIWIVAIARGDAAPSPAELWDARRGQV